MYWKYSCSDLYSAYTVTCYLLGQIIKFSSRFAVSCACTECFWNFVVCILYEWCTYYLVALCGIVCISQGIEAIPHLKLLISLCLLFWLTITALTHWMLNALGRLLSKQYQHSISSQFWLQNSLYIATCFHMLCKFCEIGLKSYLFEIAFPLLPVFQSMQPSGC